MPVTAENREYSQLAQLVPLNTLDDNALEALLQDVDIEVINKGELVFKEGDTDNQNVYLLSGRIGLLDGDSQVDLVEGSSATARFPIAHQFPRNFTAKALTRLDIVRLDSRLLSETLAQNETADHSVAGDSGDDEDVDWMSQLLESRIMQNIPAANLQGVMMRMQEKEVREGELVIKEGDEGDYYYLLHRGHASVLKLNEDQTEEVEVARLSPGASFGEDALLSKSPRSSSVKMLTDGILLRLEKDDFIELIQHPLSETVNYEEACALVEEGAMWLDVRPPEAYEENHLEGAINMPYSSLRFQIPSLATDRHYVVYSQSGTRSIASAYLFMESGLQVSMLAGGIDRVLKGDEAEKDNAPESESLEQVEENLQQPVDPEIDARDEASFEEVLQLRQELEVLRQQLAEKDEILEQSAEAPVADSEQLEQLRKENEKLEREIIGLTGQLESEEEVYDRLKQQYDALSSENKKHLQLRDKDIASLKEELTVLQLEKDQLETDFEELQVSQLSGSSEESLEELDERLQQATNQINQLEALNASITEDRDKLHIDLEEARNQLSLANQENSELQLEVAHLKDKVDELSASHARTE